MAKNVLKKLVRWALEEDVGNQDLTTVLTVPEDARCKARLVAKCDGVLSGMEPFRMAFDLLKPRIRSWMAQPDGTVFHSGDTLASFSGRARAILTGERTALNFAQRLSGVATLTAAYVEAVQGTKAQVCDTRKTTPGMRQLEKAAVSHGGGANHRHALFDGILIKENHIAAAGGLSEAVQKAVAGTHHLMKIEVEAGSLAQVTQALTAGAEVILLDNMPPDEMREAVALANGNGITLEASGNVTLETVRGIAETGVDYISVGALTHSAPACDLTLLFEGL